MSLRSLLATTACLIFLQMALVAGHGRLMDPPARNSMWRFGFDVPVDFLDNSLNCGGADKQYGQNGGKCGICGDDYTDQNGPHMAGGRFARGIIGRKYKVGQEIQVEVEITANHWGRFEMYVCPTNDPRKEATEDCLKKFPLYLAKSKDEVKFAIPKDYKKWGLFRYNVRLPRTLTCSQCVLQWTYYTGHVYGACPNNSSVTLGCGGFRTFRNCADIAIVAGSQGGNYLRPKPSEGGDPGIESPTFTYLGEGNTFNNTNNVVPPAGQGSQSFPTSRPPTPRPTSSAPPVTESTVAASSTDRYNDYNDPPEVLPTPVRNTVCIATPLFKKLYGADDWCQQNCLSYPPKCPEKMCTCPDTCDATGVMAGQPGAETWCQGLCIVYPFKCHEEKETRCKCYKAVHENSVYTDYFPFQGTKNSLGYWEE